MCIKKPPTDPAIHNLRATTIAEGARIAQLILLPRAPDKHGPTESTTAWKEDPGQSFDTGTGVSRSPDRR